ncbi:MAG: hypothetical protein HC837_02195 [Chloroflexaceae bacterium]|nr:hypothetical protein [Chloroflexaceae bacterium]
MIAVQRRDTKTLVIVWKPESMPAMVASSESQTADVHALRSSRFHYCLVCGLPILHVAPATDDLCQACSVARGLETMAEIISQQQQQTLIEHLLHLSQQAHQRGQTDAAYHALTAAYHAAYRPAHLEAIIAMAQQRIATWEHVLDECGAVRAEDYRQLALSAQHMKQSYDAYPW